MRELIVLNLITGVFNCLLAGIILSIGFHTIFFILTLLVGVANIAMGLLFLYQQIT